MGIEERLANMDAKLDSIMRKMEKPDQVPVLGKALSVDTVADILDVTPRTIYKYVREGTLRGVKVGGRVLIPDTVLHEFLERRDT